MAESSFDIACNLESSDIINAINQTEKDILKRFDLKDSGSTLDFDEKEFTIQIKSSEEYKLNAVIDILKDNFLRKNISKKTIGNGKTEHALGGTVKQTVSLQQGIPQDKAKQIVKDIKDSKLKVNCSIQGDKIRVSGKKKDDLQATMSLLKEKNYDIFLGFTNYR